MRISVSSRDFDVISVERDTMETFRLPEAQHVPSHSGAFANRQVLQVSIRTSIDCCEIIEIFDGNFKLRRGIISAHFVPSVA